MDFELSFSKAAGRRVDEDPLQVLVAADFAQDTETSVEIAQVDLDNFDDLLAKIAPSIRFEDGSVVEISEIDDFHPDQLYERLALFDHMRALRDRLSDSTTFAAAAQELTGESTAPPPAGSDGETSESMFVRLLGSEPKEDAVARLIRQVVAPHVVPSPDPRQAEMIAAVDAGITDAMRGVLHEPRFQALEAAWRGLHLLVSTLNPGESLQLYMAPWKGPDATTLLDRAGRTQKDLLVLDHRFGADASPMIAALSAAAAAANVKVIAGAASSLVGTPSIAHQPDERTWAETPPIALDGLGLALPRLMLRLPYGARQDPIDAFGFEEMVGDTHSDFLWGNGAWAATIAMVSEQRQLDHLPAYVYEVDGAKALKPVAEVCLSEATIAALKKKGLVVLASVKDKNSLRVL